MFIGIMLLVIYVATFVHFATLMAADWQPSKASIWYFLLMLGMYQIPVALQHILK